MRDVAAELQRVWPDYDGHEFVRILARRMDGSVPEAVGIALRAWAWWASRAPESELPATPEPPDPPTDAPEPEAAS